MADQKKIEQAKKVFKLIQDAMDGMKWKYNVKDEYHIETGARGDDLPIELNVSVDPDKALIMVISHIPVVVSEDKRIDVAMAVTYINNILVNGCFDYDISSGYCFFRMCNSYLDSYIGADVVKYMLLVSCQTIDEYNDKLLMIAKDMMTIQQFIASEDK